MKLVPENSPLPRLLALPLLLLFAGGLLALRLFPNLVLGLAHCPLRDMTGVPCPTCGGTHSAASLAAGRWLAALQANPVVAAGLVGFAVWAAYCLAATAVPGWRRSLRLTSGEKRAARITAALLLLLGWIYQVVRVKALGG